MVLDSINLPHLQFLSQSQEVDRMYNKAAPLQMTSSCLTVHMHKYFEGVVQFSENRLFRGI